MHMSTLFIYLGKSAHVIILRKLVLDISTKSSNVSHTFIIHNIDNTMCKDLKLLKEGFSVRLKVNANQTAYGLAAAISI